MGTANQFDLERAIATWRRFLGSARGLSGDDLDELEMHLRDEIQDLLADGLDVEAAYHKAQQRVGDYRTIEASYEQIYWKKLHHEHRLRDELTTRLSMLKNYLKIALRTLVRQKGYAFINVFGLAVGMACCLLILLFVQKERSYDRFHEHADRVYRLAYSAESGGKLTDWAYSGAQWGPTLADQFSEVEAAARLQGNLGDQTDLVRYGDKTFSERHIYLADPTVFEVFTLPLLQGDPTTALDAPYSVVLGQFAVSIALLIGTGVVYQQLDFIRSKTLGFEQDQLLTIPLSGSAVAEEATFETFRSQLLQHPDVMGATNSSNRLGERIWIWNYRPEGWHGEEDYWTLPALLVDYDYIDTYGMEIVAGRNFSRDHGSDATDAILINESTARFLGWDDSVGKTMEAPSNETPHTVTVVGVVKNFHFASLHQEVAPLIINLEEGFRRYLTVNISTDDVAETLAYLEETWAAFEPERPPQFSFVDAQFAQLYAAD